MFLLTLWRMFLIKTEIISLTECVFDRWGLDCNMSCDCTHHSLYCDNVIGCVCKPGWVGRFCELDTNECEDLGLCQSPEVCTNTLGSYRCDCEKGYQRNKVTGLCECKLILSNWKILPLSVYFIVAIIIVNFVPYFDIWKKS